MKQVLFTFSLFVLSSILIGQSFELELDKGIGTGTYEKGADIHVFANTPPLKFVFTGWSGRGSQYLDCSKEWHTTLNVPTNIDVKNISLKANFEILNSNVKMTYDSIMLWGEYDEDPATRFEMLKPYYSIIPPTKPKGVVFIYHGTGGSAHTFFRRYETVSFIQDLVYNNYAIFVLNSNETDLGDQNGNDKIQWIAGSKLLTTKDNIDLLNISLMKEKIQERLQLKEQPFFTFGVSNGGNFSDLSSAALDLKAGAHMTAHGSAKFFRFHSNVKPTIWLMARNDNHPQADSNLAQIHYNSILKKGLDSEWHWLDRSPIYPTRFARSLGAIDIDLSKKIFKTIQDLGWLDKDYFITIDTITPVELAILYKKIKLTAAQRRDVKVELLTANAEHGSQGDHNNKIIAFFDKCFETPTATQESLQPRVNIRIFPNPCVNFLKIYTPDQIISVKVFDASGKIVTEKYGNQTVEVSNLSKGQYFIQILTNGGSTTQRFIKS